MKKIIFVDAGHGGADPGAVGYVKESEINIKVTNYMCAHLEANYDCKVIKDISADSINTVVARANKAKADIFVSNHVNSGRGDGYEALIYNEKNAELARIFQKHVKEAGQNIRPYSPVCRPDLGVLRLTKMPAILNEMAFVDNKKDIKDWDEPAELKKMGIAYAKAAAEAVGAEKKTQKPTSKPTGKPQKEFLVKVQVDSLNIRKAPEIDDNIVGHIKDRGTYTIVKTTADGTWGYLKSKAGWIRILDKYAKRV